jgi:hypothetical protein
VSAGEVGLDDAGGGGQGAEDRSSRKGRVEVNAGENPVDEGQATGEVRVSGQGLGLGSGRSRDPAGVEGEPVHPGALPLFVGAGRPVEGKLGGGRLGGGHPTEPSISSSIRRFNSTAYSMGSCFTNGSMNPLTIIMLASASPMPRLMR